MRLCTGIKIVCRTKEIKLHMCMYVGLESNMTGGFLIRLASAEALFILIVPCSSLL